MKPKEIQMLGVLIAIPLIGFALRVNGCWAEPDPPKYIPRVSVEAEKANTGNEITLEVQTMQMDDFDLICRVVEAEAGNQSTIGKRLVADVVLNRVNSPIFPDTVHDVIFQPGQFTTAENGKIQSVEPTEETKDCVRREQWIQVDEQIVYFQTGGYSEYGTPWEKVGDHYFSK